MKLYRRLVKAERKRAREREERARRGANVGLVWTEHESLMPASTSGPVAVDLYVSEDAACLFPRSRTVERLQRGPGDLGDVLSLETGRLLGRVVRSHRGLIEWEEVQASGA